MSATGTCAACRQDFPQTGRGRPATYCKRPDCVLARKDQQTTARASGGAAATAKAQARKQAGVEHPASRTARIERERVAREAAKAISADRHAVDTVLGEINERLADDRRINDEQQFFVRLQAFKRALLTGQHAPTRDALLDLVVSATCWAGAINPADGLDRDIPGPHWPAAKAPAPEKPAVQLAPLVAPSSQITAPRTHPGTDAVDRYIESLAARCADLDTEQALDRVERLLGLGV